MAEHSMKIYKDGKFITDAVVDMSSHIASIEHAEMKLCKDMEESECIYTKIEEAIDEEEISLDWQWMNGKVSTFSWTIY